MPGTKVSGKQPDGLYIEVEIIRFGGDYSMILRGIDNQFGHYELAFGAINWMIEHHEPQW